MRTRTRLLAVAVGILLALALIPQVAIGAIAQPTVIDILSVNNYRHVIEDDDLLVVALIEIDYSTIPSTNVTANFIFRVVNDSDVELGRAAPVVFISPSNNLNNGYGQSVVSLYFPAATAPTWLADLTYRLDGNPGAFGAIIPSDTTTSETWNAGTDRATSGAELRSDIVDSAGTLEFDWDDFSTFVPLLLHSAGGTVLTSSGEDYFTRAIPGLRQMAPDLFFARVTPAATVTPTPFDTSYRDTLVDRLDSTSAGDGLDAMGSAMGSTGAVARTVIAVLIFGLVFWFVATKAGDGRIGLLAGSAVLVLGAGFGVPPLNALAVFALGATGVVSMVVFYARA